MKVHIRAITLRKAVAISFAQSTNARLAAIVANFTTLVAATMIKSNP